METKESILTGKECPYCHGATKFVDSAIIYGRSYGMVYFCKPCDAWCGVHKGTDQALGRLANKELREAKKEAHFFFDRLWKDQHMRRSYAYKLLSDYLDVKPTLTHIGMFDVDQCKQVVLFAKEYLNE